jgi:hypothetical protein
MISLGWACVGLAVASRWKWFFGEGPWGFGWDGPLVYPDRPFERSIRHLAWCVLGGAGAVVFQVKRGGGGWPAGTLLALASMPLFVVSSTFLAEVPNGKPLAVGAAAGATIGLLAALGIFAAALVTPREGEDRARFARRRLVEPPERIAVELVLSTLLGLPAGALLFESPHVLQGIHAMAAFQGAAVGLLLEAGALVGRRARSRATVGFASGGLALVGSVAAHVAAVWGLVLFRPEPLAKRYEQMLHTLGDLIVLHWKPSLAVALSLALLAQAVGSRISTLARVSAASLVLGSGWFVASEDFFAAGEVGSLGAIAVGAVAMALVPILAETVAARVFPDEGASA